MTFISSGVLRVLLFACAVLAAVQTTTASSIVAPITTAGSRASLASNATLAAERRR